MKKYGDQYESILQSAISRVGTGQARIVVPEAVGLHRRRPRAHFHPTPEFFLQTGGGSELECPSGTFRLRTGDICLMPAGVPHAETPLDLKTRYSILVLMRQSEGFIAVRGEASKSRQIRSSGMQGFGRGGAAFQCLELACHAGTIEKRLRRDYISHLTQAFLASIVSEICNPAPRPEEFGSPLVREAARIVRVEIARTDLSVAGIAGCLSCSPDHLTRLFRAEHGMSLGVWIANERVQLARDLLLSPQYNIAEVAWSCGFSSPSYFIRIFKARTGSTPKAWRMQNAGSISSDSKVPKLSGQTHKK